MQINSIKILHGVAPTQPSRALDATAHELLRAQPVPVGALWADDTRASRASSLSIASSIAVL